jgi:hypothetical protein
MNLLTIISPWIYSRFCFPYEKQDEIIKFEWDKYQFIMKISPLYFYYLISVGLLSQSLQNILLFYFFHQIYHYDKINNDMQYISIFNTESKKNYSISYYIFIIYSSVCILQFYNIYSFIIINLLLYYLYLYKDSILPYYQLAIIVFFKQVHKLKKILKYE